MKSNSEKNCQARRFLTPPPRWGSNRCVAERKRWSSGSGRLGPKTGLFHAIRKVPAGNSPYVKAKHVQAIERRGASLREDEGHQLESPIPQEQTVHDPTVSTSGAQLDHDISMIASYPTMRSRPCLVSVGKVPKILLDIIKQNAGETAFLAPEKKLLNSIDTVEKAVMEELHRLKRTYTAKKAEREKKVETLMSMR